jgi:hypothetical protein
MCRAKLLRDNPKLRHRLLDCRFTYIRSFIGILGRHRRAPLRLVHADKEQPEAERALAQESGIKNAWKDRQVRRHKICVALEQMAGAGREGATIAATRTLSLSRFPILYTFRAGWGGDR